MFHGYILVPEFIQKQPWWGKIQDTIDSMKGYGLDPEVYIPAYQGDECRTLMMDRGYELLPFTQHNGDTFKTEVMYNLSYMVNISDREDLSHTFRLSDLRYKQIDSRKVNLYSPVPDKFKQSSGDTEFRYSTQQAIQSVPFEIKLANAFKTTLEKAEKLRDDCITKLSKIDSVEFPLAMVSVSENEEKRYLTILASDEGEKLNSKCTRSEGPCLKIRMKSDTVNNLLDAYLLDKYCAVCSLVRDNIHELLAGVTRFRDQDYYVSVPDVLKKQSFWTEAEVLLEEIREEISYDILVQIPYYISRALINKLGK
jgi:hypothetical protein